MASLLERLIHRGWRCIRRLPALLYSDIIDAISAARGLPYPPRAIRHVGPAPEDFRKLEKTSMGHLTKLANLIPGERVLDVGCGVGRMAIPLTRYLSAEGSYEGFDVAAS